MTITQPYSGLALAWPVVKILLWPWVHCYIFQWHVVSFNDCLVSCILLLWLVTDVVYDKLCINESTHGENHLVIYLAILTNNRTHVSLNMKSKWLTWIGMQLKDCSSNFNGWCNHVTCIWPFAWCHHTLPEIGSHIKILFNSQSEIPLILKEIVSTKISAQTAEY